MSTTILPPDYFQPGDRIRISEAAMYNRELAQSQSEPLPRPVRNGEPGVIIRHPNGELDVELDDGAVGMITLIPLAIVHADPATAQERIISSRPVVGEPVDGVEITGQRCRGGRVAEVRDLCAWIGKGSGYPTRVTWDDGGPDTWHDASDLYFPPEGDGDEGCGAGCGDAQLMGYTQQEAYDHDNPPLMEDPMQGER